MTVRVLIVDDHAVVRAGIRAVVETQPDLVVVGEASDGEEALRRVAFDEPDVVLMDLQMPGMGGSSATRQIMEMEPRPQVVILTTYDSDADILTALDAGAAGYLLKDAQPEELFAAIRGAASGKTILAPAVATRLVDRVTDPADRALSGRELEVLQLVAEGLANKEVSRLLHVSEATIKTHLVHIFAKLGVDSRTAATAVAIETGLIRLRPNR